MARIAFIGLGNMGTSMVQYLTVTGHPMRAYACRPEAVDNARAFGVEPCNVPAEATRDAEVIFTNVTSTANMEDVPFESDGIIHGTPRGVVCIDHSTISAVATRRIATDLEAVGLEFLGTPVSGDTAGAQKAVLPIMVGGKAEAPVCARPLLQLLGITTTHVGDYGADQVTKMCNQIVQVINIQGIVEAMLSARAQGVDLLRVLVAIGPGFVDSCTSDLEGPKIVERNFAVGIEARLHDKDFGLVREIAQKLSLQMSAVELVASQLNTLVTSGWGYDSTASLPRVLEQQSSHHTD